MSHTGSFRLAVRAGDGELLCVRSHAGGDEAIDERLVELEQKGEDRPRSGGLGDPFLQTGRAVSRIRYLSRPQPIRVYAEAFRLTAARQSATLMPFDRGVVLASGSPRMDVRYYLDPVTGDPHIYGHGVSEEEVEYVLRHAGQDLPGREGSRQAVGQTAAGRYLRVIYVPDPEPDSVFVITAFELRGKPLKAYRRRTRHRRPR